ncbi:MAG: SsrA-binding protein SmpB [Rickettsiaceae bacterium]
MPEYHKNIANNKKALFNYFIEEKFEAGLVLKGTEVKSLRHNKANIIDSYALYDANSDSLILHNCYIAPYDKASYLNHEVRRQRVLLLHKNEIRKIIGKIKIKGYTLIALSLYFNKKNIAKVELALAKGKKIHDKRDSIKDKDWRREQERLIRTKL